MHSVGQWHYLWRIYHLYYLFRNFAERWSR